MPQTPETNTDLQQCSRKTRAKQKVFVPLCDTLWLSLEIDTAGNDIALIYQRKWVTLGEGKRGSIYPFMRHCSLNG